ncbi:MAG TPA: hypothetical protein VJ755_06700 [Gemmatimonadales bacterium]|nr:hypothetical protein [Gemmatimonadales bacterium]
MRLFSCVVVIALTACGTGKSDHSTDTLTQRQKDSILANSKLPNARAVGNAMRAADSVNVRVMRADSLARDTSQ